MPFCPSLEPCAKLTPVQVSTSVPRIHQGGGASFGGGWNSSGLRTSLFNINSNSPAQTNPTTGETSSDSSTFRTCTQLSPATMPWPDMIALASPTPRIEPIRLCELETGKPMYQVPRFQTMAEMSRAKIIANPRPEPTFSTSSTGSSARME